MAKYMFVYRSAPNDGPQASPEEMQKIFAQWTSWKEKFKKQVIDLGDGLQPGGKTLKGGEVMDGPFPEAKEIVAGYSVVEASDFDEALKVAKACPMNLVPGSSIEIRETMGY